MAATDKYRDEEDLFRALEEDDDDLEARHRETRIAQLQKEYAELQEMRQHNHGHYELYAKEKDVLAITTTVKQCVIHFFHKDFRRCEIMDKHLTALSKKHFKTKFGRIEVENANFLVDKLKIQILPCVLLFVDGIATDRIIGFEELGNTDNFTLATLEKRIAKSGAITISTGQNANARKGIFGFADKQDSDSDE